MATSTTIEAARLERDARLSARQLRLSDEKLAKEVLAGASGAFETILKRHQSGIFAFVYRMTGNADEAADIAQEVFMKAFANIEQFNHEFRFKTWLYRIAANATVDRRRRRRRVPAFSVAHEDESAGPILPSRDPGPDEIYQARETRERLECAMRKMPRTYREVLLLRYQGELSYDEIAAITSLPLGTVKNRIFRAREILKRVLN
jgi:RNA polymerase sigma-70 factor (ECF subfamily)